MVVGWLLITRGRYGWAAVAIAVGLMTKPQALPLAIPFAAFYLRRQGLAGSARAALIGLATIVGLWAPFLAANGPANYLRSLGDYSATFAVLSLRAWNPWWILQGLAGGGSLVADDVPIVGPITIRWIGYALAGVLAGLVFLWTWRRATATGLAWGVAAVALATFVGLTSMHERYAYPALVFLVLLWSDRRAVATWLLLAVAISLNLIAAVPPTGGPGAILPVGGLLGTVGSIAMTAALVATLVATRRSRASDETPFSPALATG